MSSAAAPTEVRQPGDIVVVSVHWGSNWGYQVDADQVRFAHRLIDGGIDVVHGHSSHHPRPIEVYSGKLILYGCGDLVDDYEGITGHERYRDDLRLLYLPRLDPASGRLKELRLAPFQARQLRLHRASERDAEWLRAELDEVSRGFGSRVALDASGFSPSTLRADPPRQAYSPRGGHGSVGHGLAKPSRAAGLPA